MSYLDSLYNSSEPDVAIKLPSGSTITIREMTGKDQRLFSDRAKMLSGVALTELLGNCITSLNGEPLPTNPKEKSELMLDMLAADRETAIFYIRKQSLGEFFTFKALCPSCGKTDAYEINLKEMENTVTAYPQGNTKEIRGTLSNGMKVKWYQLDGHAEVKLLKDRNNLHQHSSIEARKPMVLDEEVTAQCNKETWVHLNVAALLGKYADELSKLMKQAEGSIDTSIAITCTGCASEVIVNLLGERNFLIPNATS